MHQKSDSISPMFAEIDGRKIEIDHHVVDPQQPTLVFLHEGLGCVQMWRDFPAALAEATGCNYLNYSRFGYGQSDLVELPRPVRYMHDEALIFLPALFAKLNIGKHILVGHSDGASIALINGGGAQGSPSASNLVSIISEAAHVFNEEVCVKSIEAAAEAYKRTDLREKLARYHADVDNAFWGWNNVWLEPDFREWNIEEYLPKITVPLLAIQGIDDQYGTRSQIDAIEHGVGEARVEKHLLADCKHVPHHEQREQTFTIMRQFIDQVLKNELIQD